MHIVLFSLLYLCRLLRPADSLKLSKTSENSLQWLKIVHCGVVHDGFELHFIQAPQVFQFKHDGKFEQRGVRLFNMWQRFWRCCSVTVDSRCSVVVFA